METLEDGEWASNKKFINCLKNGDTITVPYKVEKPEPTMCGNIDL